MIVYHPSLIPSLKEFGLDIPIHSNRWLHPLANLPPSLFYDGLWKLASPQNLSLAHTQDYTEFIFKEPKRAILQAYEGEQYFTLKPQKPFHILLESTMKHLSATLTTCQIALERGWSYAMGGGMHHALSFTGQGFCLINDVVISLRILQREKKIRRALIIDVDIHKGDGTAEITQGDDSLYTVSLHGHETWPLKGGGYPESLIPSNSDQAISESCTYLKTLEHTLHQLPKDFDLCLVVQGADLYEKDTLPGSHQLNLTLEDMLKRDQMIHRWLESHSIPQAYCMGGGYGEESWRVYDQYLTWVCTIKEKSLH